jgi:signal transduction histidine kinase
MVVQIHSSMIRGALMYLLPASRALLLFGERPGLALSLGAWVGYGLNVLLFVWPDRTGEFANYVLFLLPLYAVSVVLTLAAVRQAAEAQRRQGLYDELSAAHAELKALNERAREAAATEERNRIAREIHDSVAHYLTVVNVQLEAAEKLGRDQPARATEHVRRARRLAVECLQEVRRSVGALRTSSLEELSLPRALDRLTDDFARSTGIDVRLDVAWPEEARLAPAAAQALYRTAQEGLTNVQRHARAGHVRVALQRQDGAVELVVQDDGVGPRDGAAVDGGFGLLGLRERVALLGGELTFGPASPRGSQLSVHLPAAEA